jgi:hypothetical protein
VLTYAIHGQILTVTSAGHSTPTDQTETFAAIRMDADVPYGARLLVDAQETTDVFEPDMLSERAARMLHALGPKLAPVCAIVGPPSQIRQGSSFQSIAGQAGLCVGLFGNLSSARSWLATYVPHPGRELRGYH